MSLWSYLVQARDQLASYEPWGRAGGGAPNPRGIRFTNLRANGIYPEDELKVPLLLLIIIISLLSSTAKRRSFQGPTFVIHRRPHPIRNRHIIFSSSQGGYSWSLFMNLISCNSDHPFVDNYSYFILEFFKYIHINKEWSQ